MRPAPEFDPAVQAVSVLLVEDDPDFAALVRRCVAGLDGRPALTTAATLQQALQALASGTFDLILADLGLPDSSGLETLQRIAAATERPVIILTANEEPGIREAALGAGAYEFLHKNDFDAPVLARLVRLAAIQARTFRSLRESESRFRSLVGLSSDYYWEQDATHRLTYVSAELDVLGRRRWEADIGNLSETDWAAHRADLEARRAFRDLELMRRDDAGEERWVAISGEPVYDEAGRFRGYRGIGRDITARKRDEEELLRFRAAIDASADMIVVVDRATMKYIDVNRTICRLLGYSRAEMLGMGPQDLLPVERGDLERVYDALIADPRVENSTRTRYRCKDGSLLPLESMRRALKSGERWLIVSVGRDIRARLAAEHALEDSEARFRSLTQLSSDWYWEQDSEFRLTFMSSRMGARTGLAASSYLGRRRWDQPALNLTEADWDRHRAQLERHEPFRDFEMERKAPDGTSAWLSISGEPVYDAEGQFRGYRGVGQDITAQKAAQAALLRFRTALDRSADMFFLVDMKDGRLLDFNETACAVLGYEREELIGRTSEVIIADRSLEEILASFAELARIRVCSGETSYRRKDGSTFPAEARRTVLETAEGEILVVNSRDLSERKIEEARKAAHLRYQQRIAAFGQSALACRDPQELSEDAVQQVLLALGAETVAYLERGRDPGQLVARALIGADQAAERTTSSVDDPVS
ncbi:MAG: hypothetical protein QOD26_2958, partial [Betaproteobacteria bacterium]|nr:hypothetical protein [Betaproteobacteria bacterium]